MAVARTALALPFLGVAAASVADTVKKPWRYDPKATAVFGAADLDADVSVRGMLKFHLGSYNGYQTVNWTTSGITIPTNLIQEVCGSTPDMPTFTYSINEKWGHGEAMRSAQGTELCGEAYTGRHWDPSAACSPSSGNDACTACARGIEDGYSCQPDKFSPKPDAAGSHAYRFLNEHACELGDLSGMSGELLTEAGAYCVDLGAQCEAWAKLGECKKNPYYMLLYCQKSCEACTTPAGTDNGFVKLRSLTNETAGAAQMSTPFGVISADSVIGDVIGINCDASGPPPVHGTDCECLTYNGKRSPSIGSMTVFRPVDHSTFFLARTGLLELEGNSVVVQCGSSFASSQGRPLFCAQLM